MSDINALYLIGSIALLFLVIKLIYAERKLQIAKNTDHADLANQRYPRKSRLSLHRNQSIGGTQRKWREVGKNTSNSRSPSDGRNRKISQARYSPYVCNQLSTSSVGNNAPNSPSCNPIEKYRKRLYIISELLKTEISYVEALELINNTVLEPLVWSSKSHGALLEKKLINMIFSNFQDILSVNREFLRQLSERLIGISTSRSVVPSDNLYMSGGGNQQILINLKRWNPIRDIVADIFINMAPFFKMYSVYVKNFTFALETLENQLTNNQALRSFVDDVKSKNTEFKNKNLGFFLIMPVQRIPRYRLLLQDLLLNTPEDHADRFHISNALAKIESVADFVNEQIRLQENALKIYEIQQKMVGLVDGYGKPATLIQPGRILLKQGSMRKICIKDFQTRIFFLFNDMLIYAAPRNPYLLFGAVPENYREVYSDFIYRHRFSLSEVELVDVLFDSRNHVTHVANVDHSFLIRSGEKSIQVVCESDEEKIDWIHCISVAIKNNSKQKLLTRPNEYYLSPVWLPDGFSSTCMSCGAAFYFLRRRHHCRNCGAIICQQCSSKRLLLPRKKTPERVCDICYLERLSSINDSVKAYSGAYSARLSSINDSFKAYPAQLKTASEMEEKITLSCSSLVFSRDLFRLSERIFGSWTRSVSVVPGNDELSRVKKQ